MNEAPQKDPLRTMTTLRLLPLIGLVLVGCGGSTSGSGSGAFQGTWSGSGTITNQKNSNATYSGTISMLVLSDGTVSGSDNVTTDAGTESESGIIANPTSTLTLTEPIGTTNTSNTYTVSATVSINSAGQMIWTGTETIGGAIFNLSYTLTKS